MRWSWLRPPAFSDEAKAHEAFLLHVIVWSMVVVPPPYLLFSLLRTPQFAERALIQSAAGEAMNCALLLMLRRGAVRLASVLQVTALFGFMSVTAWTLGGVENPGYQLGYALAIVIAGVLIGFYGAAVVCLAALISGFLMQSRGVTDPLAASQRASIWIVSAVIFPVIAVVQYLASRTVRNALKRASVGEQKFRLLAEASFEGLIVHDQGVIFIPSHRCGESRSLAARRTTCALERWRSMTFRECTRAESINPARIFRCYTAGQSRSCHSRRSFGCP